MKNSNYIKISDLLNSLIEDEDKEFISFGEIADILSSKGFGLLMIIFALPNIIPIPGLSTITGIPLILFSTQLLFGYKKPWLPNLIREKTISFKLFKKIIQKSISYFVKIEFLFKKRVNFFSNKIGRSVIGLSAIILSIVLTLPIVFANAIPTIAIILLAIGLITEDGMAVIFGIILGLFGISIAIAVILIGFESVKFLINKFY